MKDRTTPMPIADVLGELAQNPAYAKLGELLAEAPPFDPYARCISCKGTGERGVYREIDTNEWVSRECRDCQGTGIDPVHLDGAA